MPISWVRGHDLMNEESVLVPMFLAGYHMYFHETPCYPIATTNGIASGNSYEEAVCHALCEVIERDDWTIADLVSNRLSRVLVNGALGPVESPAVAAWFRDLHPNIELASLPPRAQALVDRFDAAGLCLELKNITSATGIPSVLAVVAEDVAPTFSHSHYGLGTHPDAEVAAVRAVTEVAQSRVVDIQSLREDITLPDEKVDKWFYHVQRSATVNRQSWYFTRSAARVRLDDVPSHPSDDIVADIHLMLERLRRRGMTRAIVVDLSAPGIPAKVVRVIVPGVESWAIDRSKLGPRAAAAWNEALTTLHGARAAALAITG